jgi:hypothetical protein
MFPPCAFQYDAWAGVKGMTTDAAKAKWVCTSIVTLTSELLVVVVVAVVGGGG